MKYEKTECNIKIVPPTDPSLYLHLVLKKDSKDKPKAPTKPSKK